MASADAFLSAAKSRRSIYTLSSESTIPDSRVEEIVKYAATWAPSSYNVQSARLVIMLGAKHRKLWEISAKHILRNMDGDFKAHMTRRFAGWTGSHGTVSKNEARPEKRDLLLTWPVSQGNVF